jgi:hypothetical protein
MSALCLIVVTSFHLRLMPVQLAQREVTSGVTRFADPLVNLIRQKQIIMTPVKAVLQAHIHGWMNGVIRFVNGFDIVGASHRSCQILM